MTMKPENDRDSVEMRESLIEDAPLVSPLELALSKLQCVLVARRTIMNPDGITWPQYDTLDLLRQQKNLTPSILGEKLGFARPKMSKILRSLKDAGLIEQVSGVSDKREMITRLSTKGERFLSYAEASRHNMATQVESCLSKGEAAIFAELSNKIADMLYHTMPKQSE
ncbi:MarR family transcriptional regulator [Dickeya dadantii]|uniref:MarR family winged helix-turn-helix transcriptional regulator n=1 Tax=Dickeya dadantii TaxID=204038 RepID=UPI001CF5D2C8|nr:MarR family transcriptional regulator [Dickeya dadantii]MCA7014960.1 MarR family transcriptional regulator [Dickeya dadantii]